jgi:transketolase
MRNAVVERLSALAEHDPKLILITGDLGFGVLTEFAKRFPKQYLNVGVAEQNMLGVAVGLALGGRTALVYSIANFPTLRCLEQIRNDACYHEANVKILAVGGGFSYGGLGISHYATEDLAVLRSLPGMTVVSPSSKWEAQQAIDALVRTAGPGYLRIDKSFVEPDEADPATFRLGRFRQVREGRDISLLATGGILATVIQAADSLLARGIRARVYSVHTIKPFDHDGLRAAVKETGGIVTVEEHTLDGGLGSVVAESCLDHGLQPKTFLRLGVPGRFPEVIGSQDYLRRYYKLDAGSIGLAVTHVLDRVHG